MRNTIQWSGRTEASSLQRIEMVLRCSTTNVALPLEIRTSPPLDVFQPAEVESWQYRATLGWICFTVPGIDLMFANLLFSSKSRPKRLELNFALVSNGNRLQQFRTVLSCTFAPLLLTPIFIHLYSGSRLMNEFNINSYHSPITKFSRPANLTTRHNLHNLISVQSTCTCRTRSSSAAVTIATICIFLNYQPLFQICISKIILVNYCLKYMAANFTMITYLMELGLNLVTLGDIANQFWETIYSTLNIEINNQIPVAYIQVIYNRLVTLRLLCFVFS